MPLIFVSFDLKKIKRYEYQRHRARKENFTHEFLFKKAFRVFLICNRWPFEKSVGSGLWPEELRIHFPLTRHSAARHNAALRVR